MRVLVLDSAAEAAARAADEIAAQLARKPQSVLGLATGETMVPLYARLRTMAAGGALSFAGARSFNLDEYVGLAADDPRSYHAFMRAHLFDHIDIDPARVRLPRGDAPDPEGEARRYEDAISAAGGIDLQLLGIGRNGHIGFNEPGCSLAAGCHVAALADETRAANARHFPGRETPGRAITVGVGTIMAARRCLLLATGAAKAAAVARMIEGPVSAACPASALRTHPCATAVLDRAAAGGLAAPPAGADGTARALP